MNNKKDIAPNKKKIIFEIIIIPICILYLYYMTFNNHPKIILILSSIVLTITCIEFIVLYIHEVYIYKSKYNFLKILNIILSFLLIIFTVINLLLKLSIIKTIYFILIVIFLIHLLYFIIKNIIKIIKGKGTLYKNVFASFFGLISFMIIIIGVIISL